MKIYGEFGITTQFCLGGVKPLGGGFTVGKVGAGPTFLVTF